MRGVNDLLLFVDSGNCAISLLLDLSAVFDIVDNCIRLNRLKTEVDICAALNWFESYFTMFWQIFFIPSFNHVRGATGLHIGPDIICFIYHPSTLQLQISQGPLS